MALDLIARVTNPAMIDAQGHNPPFVIGSEVAVPDQVDELSAMPTVKSCQDVYHRQREVSVL
jgi:hypothetical protein